MAYVDYIFYSTEYIGDVIQPEDFPKYEKRARVELDRLTFDRLKKDDTLITSEVKECTCAIAEALYEADMDPVSASSPLSSYSNDGESGTFDLSNSMHTESGKAKRLREIARRYLTMTGLLYAGVGGR